MIKPLIISREFLIDNSPTGECVRVFASNMQSKDWEPFVYCSDKKYKNPLSSGNQNVKVIHETLLPQLWAAFVRRALIPDLTWLPGYEWSSWGKRCEKTILKDIKSGLNLDYIHTVSFPCACHTVGMHIKQKTGLPWVAQFYDPWADNPYRPFKTKYFKAKDWKLEREVVENADIIIHDNEPIAELWRKRYGKELANKIVVLPLTVPLPSKEAGLNQCKEGDTLTISHIGNFMLNRTSIPFLNAVISLFKEHPELSGKLHVNFIGQVTEKEKEIINSNELNKVINLVGVISPKECEPYYEKTDLFLAIDGVNKTNLFFPSKILKYLYYNKPILGITPRGSVLDYELHASGHAVFMNENITGIKDYLYKAITDYSSVLNYDSYYWHRFDPKNVLQGYKRIIEERIFKNIC